MLEYSQRLSQQLRGRLADETGLGGPLWSLTARAGADALDIPAGGIEAGYLADLAVLSADAPPLQGPLGGRALDALLTAGGRENISDVYVGGKRLVRDGVVPYAQQTAGRFAKAVRSLMDE
jgi:cytosine/adenosine deaminase-related metal-dependent hydrolase